MPLLKNLWREEEGSVLVIVSVAMVAILGLAALVIDVGVLYLHRLNLVNAADAAALAGVTFLPNRPVYAQTTAVDYANYNSQPEEVQVEIGDNSRSLTVRLAREVDFYLARLLGRDNMRIQASAKARAWTLTGARGVAPFAVEKQEFVFGETYYLKVGAQNKDQRPFRGNFGVLALGGQGANVYYNNLVNGYQGWIRINDQLDTEPGNMVGKTRQGVQELMNRCHHHHVPACTYLNYQPGCPRLLITPVVDSLKVSGRSLVTVVGFAAFFLEEFDNSQDYVVGRFVRSFHDGEWGEGADYGTMVAGLVE
ncbi:MAG: pilus assembly protein TadG-related protein [Limnochordia bacterium]|jgi:hypothetical protein